MSVKVVCYWVAARPRVIRRAIVTAVIRRPRVVRRMMVVCTVVPISLTPGLFPAPERPPPTPPTTHGRLESAISGQARREVASVSTTNVPGPGPTALGLGAVAFAYAVWRGRRK